MMLSNILVSDLLFRIHLYKDESFESLSKGMNDGKTIGSHQNILKEKLCPFQQIPQNIWNRTRANGFQANE